LQKDRPQVTDCRLEIIGSVGDGDDAQGPCAYYNACLEDDEIGKVLHMLEVCGEDGAPYGRMKRVW
jgi:hypothetical protein